MANSTLTAFSGSRMSGYAGVRRRESMDASVGTSAFGIVPSRVRAAITEHKMGLRELFAKIDVNSDGVLSQDELTKELYSMDVGLSHAECVSVFKVLADGAENITLDAWLDWVKNTSVTARADENSMPAKDAPGSRIPGYAGDRRRASMDASVGTSGAGKVSTQLRDKLLGAGALLEQVFTDLDADGSKTLSFAELLKGLAGYGIELSDDEFEALFSEIDGDASGEIAWGTSSYMYAPLSPVCRI